MRIAKSLLLCVAALAVAISPIAAFAAEEAKTKVGDKVELFSFKDIRYLERTLTEFPDAKFFVVVCTNTSCPVVEQYLPKLKRLEAEYRDKGVQFVALNTRQDDAIVEMASQAVEFDIPFPFVKDMDGSCVKALGVSRTPEVAVIDAQQILRYRGRIDDQYRLGGAQPNVNEESLKAALDALIEGKEVAVKETPVDGCAITAFRTPEARKDLTYSEHIKPLIQKHCAECHRPGTEAPFSLLTYEDVTKQGAMISEVVDEQRMPPWYGDPKHAGTFTNERKMPTADRLALLQWVEGGMQPGNLDPKAEESAVAEVNKSSWLIGEPDKIITLHERHDLPAEGFVDYKYVTLPYIFTKDMWVQGVQIQPDNPRVVHHCNLLAFPVAKGPKASSFITGRVPGSPPMDLAGTGTAVHIPAGTALLFQIHYVTTGKPETCQISLGLKYYQGVVKKKMRNFLVDHDEFEIPPGDPHHPVINTKTFNMDAEGIGMFSHMHVRGKDMSFFAHYPDGKKEHLLTVPNYSFDWQLGYEWEPGTKKFPKGTKIEVIAHYDNSKFNPYNPNPADTVRYGQQTHEEMLNGFMFYTAADENLNIEVDPKTGEGKPLDPAKSEKTGD